MDCADSGLVGWAGMLGWEWGGKSGMEIGNGAESCKMLEDVGELIRLARDGN